MDVGSGNGMVTLTMGNGKMENIMDTEYTSAQMETNMKENGRMIRETAMALTNMEMATSMSVAGIRVISMAME